MTTIDTSICIIGAGPAGASTSIFLAKKGIAHTIVDASEFPRDKVCGDALDGKTLRTLNQMDPNIIKNEIANHPDFIPCWGMRFISLKGRFSNFIYPQNFNRPYKCPIYVSKRVHFDNFLVQKIDTKFANFMAGTKVNSISKNGKKWQIHATDTKQTAFTILADCIVGADGDHSVLLRYLGTRKIDRNHYAGAVRQYWKGITGLHDKNLIEIYYPKSLPMGYLWIFPLPNGEANVGLGMLSKYASKAKVNFKAMLKEMVATDPAIAHRFKNATPLSNIEGWGLPLASLKRDLAGDGYLLTGDAGSMISPSSGEGIGNAMMTGYIAAQFIQNAVNKNDFSAASFKNYNREVFRHFKGEINIHNLLLKVNVTKFSMWLLNMLISGNPLFKKYYEATLKKWVNTAYEKPITVNIN
ncbi:MAG: NAD(P)/FAD-dependent oxidoreductase [Flavobacterium sp.]|nr:NAD(P)/FAD-dependent oxidoreductase [Flavobacterium sp.]